MKDVKISHRRLLEEDILGNSVSSKPTDDRFELKQNTSKKTPTKLYSNFDSSLALTVLVVFTAFFFLGLFTFYTRRLSEETQFGESRRRRWRRQQFHTGLDELTLQKLPVFSYTNEDKYDDVDCAICLGEFTEREMIKIIPNCRHIFHVQCIDTWLSEHPSCPICRSTELFPSEISIKMEEGLLIMREGLLDNGENVRLNSSMPGTAEECNILGLRRSSSSSSRRLDKKSMKKSYSF